MWLGTSIVCDEYSWRADELRATPAAVRFLSLEPLLSSLPCRRRRVDAQGNQSTMPVMSAGLCGMTPFGAAIPSAIH
ncbi:MAG TPA: DUF5131 family protein [Mycobacterium sp.]